MKDGDVTTNGDLRSLVPAAAGLYFDTIGDGGYPGIPAYGGATSLNQTRVDVSATGWLANSGYNATKIYNSAYFLNAIPADTTIIQVPSSSVDGSFFQSGGTPSYGYYWYEYDPALNGNVDLTINTSMNLGARKVILIAKGANVNLKGNINITKGQGFFMLIAGKNSAGAKGNIIVDPSVGGGASVNLEGIYVADGQLQTGIAAIQLKVRGTVAAYGGISLQRDLGAGNSTTPAELFEFAPDLALLFPRTLGVRSMNWQEVAP